jgi:cardiolipin synthase
MIPMTAEEHSQSRWKHSRILVEPQDFYRSLLAAMEAAQHSIELESYIFQLDALGESFVLALAAAAQRGVKVRVLVDGVGSSQSCLQLAERLFAQGVAVRIYHPLPWLTRGYRWSRQRGGWLYKFLLFLLNINRRNHRKLCVVDARTAWVGSFNISMDHLSRADGGQGWRDYAIELQGRDIASLVKGFDLLWSARDPIFHRGFIARYLSNRGIRARRLKNRFVARRVSGCQQRTWLVSAYFAPTASLRRALLRACRNGRDVCLLLPESSDVAMFPGLSSHYYHELLRAGARIFLYQAGVLHAKALLVDDMSIIGSSNWNYRSSLHDLELDVVIADEETQKALETVVKHDFEQGRELTLKQTPRPTLLSWLWYILRYWM